MGSFSGYKLVGVNPHSANVGVAMMLADFITNEDNQNKRFNDRKLGSLQHQCQCFRGCAVCTRHCRTG